MQIDAGSRVRARGLTWDVVERENLGPQQRLRLRCTEDDLQGLEWDLLWPREPVQPLRDALDPEAPAPLADWLRYHRACLLEQIPGTTGLVATQPGRLKLEPYQLVPVMRALSLPRPRLLLADGVGLGKTIEAGLIAAELIVRRRAHRILIVAPAGPLLKQWEQEMRLRFGLRFAAIADAHALRAERLNLEYGGNPFATSSFVLTSLDFAKQESVLQELERTAWDLTIVDEAHHCIGTAPGLVREDTQRRRLAELLARQSDGLLLLTATPHDGHDPHFASLIALLDPSLVDGKGGLAGLAYRRHVVRRLKAHIADPVSGRPLFRERRVIPVPIRTDDPAVARFHRTLSALVAPRVGKASESRKFADALAFVSLLKRSVSTIAACVGTLRVVADRYAGLGGAEPPAERRDRIRTLRAYRRRALRYGVLDAQAEADVARLEAEDIAADLLASGDTEAALRDLIRLGEEAEAYDPKLQALIEEIQAIRAEEPDANVLIYTEYADSQTAAVRALQSPRIAGEILTIGGQDTEDDRTAAAERFAQTSGVILISTDSLAEGLNLQQRCHRLIHLDLPYNPNRLEQRNGRIDRYGQIHDPEIRYFCLAGTFEERLLLRLIAKYEKARQQLTFMPDTLGMTAAEDRLGTGLLMGLAEEQATLFPEDSPAIRTLDIAASETGTEAYRELLHEIDRAYAGFEGMAVRHGWMAGQGLSAGARQMAAATRARDAAADQMTYADATAFAPTAAGRADPAMRQAIGRTRQSHDKRVSVARHTERALLLTYTIEIHSQRHIAYQRTIAVWLPAAGVTRILSEPEDWLPFAAPSRAIDVRSPWREFETWAPRRMQEAEHAATAAMHAMAETVAARHDAEQAVAKTHLADWIARRTDALCGPRQPVAEDLFGTPPAGPAWRHTADPIARLTGFAADPTTSAEDRGTAGDILTVHRQRLSEIPVLQPPALHRAGLLMLVPTP